MHKIKTFHRRIKSKPSIKIYFFLACVVSLIIGTFLGHNLEKTKFENKIAELVTEKSRLIADNQKQLAEPITPNKSVEPKSKTWDDELLHIKNAYDSASLVKTLDLNNDGIDEIIYEPRSMSWSNRTYILKEDSGNKNHFVPFCEHCEFETYTISAEFEDLNNDGLLDVRLPTVMEIIDGEYKIISNVIYLFDGKDYQKQ